MSVFKTRRVFISLLALSTIGFSQSDVISSGFSVHAEAAETAPSAPQESPSAPTLGKGKKLPKNSLMFGIYCNTVNDDIKKHYDKSHTAPPWRASGKREEALNAVFEALDHQGSGNVRAVKEGMLSQNEVNFLVYKGKKDAQLWMNNIDAVCGKLPEGEEYSDCQRLLHTEIYKCYVYLEERVKDYFKFH